MDKETFDKAEKYIGKYMDAVDAFDDGLMKVHEFIGTVQDHVDAVFQGAIDGVWKLSELVDKYRDDVYARVEEDRKKVYGEPGTPYVDEFTDAPTETEEPTHQEKVDFLINAYGVNSVSAKETFNELDDKTINDAYEALKRFQ